MRIFNRGQTIPFVHTFYDSAGGITSPTSVRLTVSYPSTSGYPLTGELSTTYVTMTQSTAGSWSGNLQTYNMGAGRVWWDIRSDDLTQAVESSFFDLRGNPANLSITTTTT